jgi:divalent metal cation (Fe/Co/Zn/Cd) transporter
LSSALASSQSSSASARIGREIPVRLACSHAYVSLAVIASAIVVALGVPVAHPLIGLGITLVILRITWQSWVTVRTERHT